MAKIRDIPLGTYPAGVYPITKRALPNGSTGLEFRMGRCTTATPDLWASASTIVTIAMDFSFDGGVTFPNHQQFGPRAGGIITQRGVELAEDNWGWGFAPNQPTHLQGTITVEGPDIRSYLDVTIP